MKLEVNIDKKHFIVLLSVFLVLIGTVIVHPYVNPTTKVGHTGDEIESLAGSKIVGSVPANSWPEGHYCILKSACDPCPPGFTQTHEVDMPNAGRKQSWAVHIGDGDRWDCNNAVGTSDCNANRPEFQWDTLQCWNAYMLFCCK